MPDKIYRKDCGKDCVRCWRNRLKHGNPESKRYLKKQMELEKGIEKKEDEMPELLKEYMRKEKVTETHQQLFGNKYIVDSHDDDLMKSEEVKQETIVSKTKGEIRKESFVALAEVQREPIIVQ